jgi:DNA-directed RNA polymerases I, II, and III subunit RPABC5
MIIPIRCFTCGKLIAHLWEHYEEELQKEYNKQKNMKKRIYINIPTKPTIEKKVLDSLGIHKYCCRRMFLGHVDLCDKI